MKQTMSHFGEVNPVPLQSNVQTTDEAAAQQSNALFTTASSLAEKSLTTTLDKAAQIAQSAEIQLFIKENGLEPYLKDVTQDRIKNILALAGLWYFTKLAKTKVGLGMIGALGIYVLYSNRSRLTAKIADKVSA